MQAFKAPGSGIIFETFSFLESGRMNTYYPALLESLLPEPTGNPYCKDLIGGPRRPALLEVLITQPYGQFS